MNTKREKRVAEFRREVMAQIDYAFDMLGHEVVVARLKDKVKTAISIDLDNVDMNDIVRDALDAMYIDYTDLDDVEEMAKVMTEAWPWIMEAKAVETGESRLFCQEDGRREVDEGYFDDYLSVEFLNDLVGDNEEVTTAGRWLADMAEGHITEGDEDDVEEWKEFQNTAKYKEVLEIEKRDPYAVIYIESDDTVNDLGDECEITGFGYDNRTYDVRKEYKIEFTIN